jgi:hypothetical protein
MILHQPASPGWMVSLQKLAAETAQPAYDELVRQLRQQAVLCIDESPTKEGKAKSWIWTFVAATFTLFATRTSRAADILVDWLGERLIRASSIATARGCIGRSDGCNGAWRIKNEIFRG